MSTIDLIAGSRTDLLKLAPIRDALQTARKHGGGLESRVIHSGPHFERKKKNDFFIQLGIARPDIDLEVSGGTQAEQTGNIMFRYERGLSVQPSSMCLVVGDNVPGMACAIVAKKMGIPVAHVEGGNRSNDWSLPEETNRVVIDSVSNWFFTTSETANGNLHRSGVGIDRIFFVGNTLADMLRIHLPNLKPATVWEEDGLKKDGYFVVVLRRPENVDIPESLREYLRILSKETRKFPVILPVNPRTEQALTKMVKECPNFRCIPTLGYLEMLHLVRNAKGILTDSGEMSVEATVLGVPCLTLLDKTEYPETVTSGTNVMIGSDLQVLHSALNRILAGKNLKNEIPEKWDGYAAERIVEKLVKLI